MPPVSRLLERVRAEALAWQSHFSEQVGDIEAAGRLAERSLAILDILDLGDQEPAQRATGSPIDCRSTRAFALWAKGMCTYQVSLEQTRRLFERSLALYRALGDPRIAYNADNQKVEVLEARTRLPNGKFVDLADYSTVEVAPDASGGWPAFGGLHQRVMVMGGIEAGCVLETEYTIMTKAGARPYLAADLRIDRRYPVRAVRLSGALGYRSGCIAQEQPFRCHK